MLLSDCVGLRVVRCLLFVVRFVLFDGCCLLGVVCCLLCVVCGVLFAYWLLLLVGVRCVVC